MLALLAPFLGSALGLGTMGTAGIGALLGAASAGMQGAKGNDLLNAALLGGIGGGLGGSILGQAGTAAGAAQTTGANALTGAGAVAEAATPAIEAAGGLEALTGSGAVPELAANASMPGMPTSGWDRLTQQVDGLSRPEFWKDVGMMRPAGMMYAMGGINDIGVAAQERKRQKKLQEAFKPRWAVDNPYGTARRLSEGGEVEVSRGVRKAQIDRAVAEAEGRPTRGQKPSMGPASAQGTPQAPGADFFKPRGKPAESQEDAVRRIRGTPQRYAAGGIAQIPNTTMTGRFLSGKSDGQADQIAAMIDGEQPAALSHGEFIVPADAVAMLGNGNSEAGADTLQKMIERVRMASTGKKEQIKPINPKKVLPA